MELSIGNEYNLNNVEEIKVTNEFLGLNRKVTGCQHEETYDDCKTRSYIKALLNKCQCLPFGINQENEVSITRVCGYLLTLDAPFK